MKKFTLKLALLSLAMVTLACSTEIVHKPYNDGINVIPVPKQLSITDSTQFTLTANTVVAVSTPDFANPAAYLAAKIQKSTGYALTIAEQAPDNNFISLEINTRIPVGHEGYTLSSNQNGVVIAARTPQGAFYGVQTLLQLLPAEIESSVVVNNTAWNIPAVEVVDEPRFEYRGIMLDVCRHFETVDFIKKQLDVLAMFKVNRFHWHLTEDQAWRIEIKKYPKLTELGSLRTEGDGKVYGPFFYTQEQIKEVVAYATERYIDVIPEIELPGHALAALVGYPELSCTGGPFKQPRIIWGVEEDVYCVGKEETFEFLQNVIDEVVPLFPSKYFHIGADECPKNKWKTCPDCQKRIKDNGIKADKHHSAEAKLQSYTVDRIEKYLKTKGKNLIGWDEILEGGLTPSSTVMSWRGLEGGIAAAKNGNDAIMTPGPGGMYIDHLQGAAEVEPTSIGGYAPLSKTYSYEPVPEVLTEDEKKFIKGAQINMWTEYCGDGEIMEYMIYPRLLALSELTWAQLGQRDFNDFTRRLSNAEVRLDLHGINYHIPMPEGTLTQNVIYTTDNTTVEFNNTRNLAMVYTTDGSEPTAKSTLYTKPIEVTGNGEIKIATKLLSDKLSKTRVVKFEKQTFAPAVADAGTTKGAKLKVAEGLYPTFEDFKKARFSKDTVVTTLFEDKLWDMNKPALAVFEGYFEVPADSVYTFTSDMDMLQIDGKTIIENEKLSRHNKMKAQMALQKGKHKFTLTFNNMIKDGWPNNWNRIGFLIQDNEGKWNQVETYNMTY